MRATGPALLLLLSLVACGEPSAPAADAGDADGAIPERDIEVLEGRESYCPDQIREGRRCDAERSTFWWCTDRTTCDIWACAPRTQGGTWRLLEEAPAGGCTDGCPNDFDAAAEMDYCQDMVCLERSADTCRDLRCVIDAYELYDVDCPAAQP
jgi:hypothetical protein